VLNETEVAALKPKLIASLPKDTNCERLKSPDPQADEGDNDISLTPLDDTHALIPRSAGARPITKAMASGLSTANSRANPCW
jgi:hypothetical protein